MKRDDGKCEILQHKKKHPPAKICVRNEAVKYHKHLCGMHGKPLWFVFVPISECTDPDGVR